MRESIELQGRWYDTIRALCERFDVSSMTLQRWKKKGLLPDPIRIGLSNFYVRDELEARLAGDTVKTEGQ